MKLLMENWRRFINEGEMLSLKIGGKQLRVEVAASDEKRQNGLMFREGLEQNAGMLFIFEDSVPRSFWMKNTSIPLSIAYLDESRRILNIEDMNPHDLKGVPSRGPAKYVIEANKGWFEENNISPGALVEGLPL